MTHHSESHPDSLIRAEKLYLARRHKQVLENVSLNIIRGQIVTLIGPNGCGKSTLLNILLGLVTPDAGQVTQQTGIRIGYMPQRLNLEPRLPLTVNGFLKLARGANRADIDYWLTRLDIQSIRNQDIQDLSGGEWQRVLLARALLLKPDVLMLDEPVQGVDVQGQLALYQLIPQLRDELNCAVVMVSHDLHLVMAATDEVICMNGHICCSGHPDQVTLDPAYQQLFGQPLAHYTHHHDHQHCLDGHIEQAESGL